MGGLVVARLNPNSAQVQLSSSSNTICCQNLRRDAASSANTGHYKFGAFLDKAGVSDYFIKNYKSSVSPARAWWYNMYKNLIFSP